MKKLFIIAFLTVSTLGYSQKLRVEAVNKDFEMYRKSLYFDYISDSLSSEKYTWVMDMKITFDTIFPGTIKSIYNQFKERAHRLGANAFKVTDSDIYVIGDEKFIDVSAYWLRMEDREENLNYFKEPKVYIFGFLGHHIDIEGYEIKVDENEFVLHELRFKSFNLRIGQEMYLQQGGNLRGDYRNIKFDKPESPKYYFFNRVTGSMKNCWIDEYSQDFGEFLIRILKVEHS